MEQVLRIFYPLDNGALLGVQGIGDIKIPVWRTQPLLPSSSLPDRPRTLTMNGETSAAYNYMESI